MRVENAMSTDVLTIGPGHTVAEAAALMVARNVGAAVVLDDTMPGPGILTERDILRAVGSGSDLQAATVADHMTWEVRTASTSWDLDTAAAEMVKGNFRHLVVCDDRGQLVGVVSMRDIVRARSGSPSPA